VLDLQYIEHESNFMNLCATKEKKCVNIAIVWLCLLGLVIIGRMGI
jgi:hypothetical protein